MTRRRKLWKRLGLLLLLAIMIFWLQRALLFPGQYDSRPSNPPPADAEQWWLETDAGPVEAWFLPAIAEEASAAPTVVYAHGNGERIDLWPDMLMPYRRMGLNVVLAEYRGYGESAGRPSEDAIAADLVLLMDRLEADERVDPSRIVLHGRSLGGGAMGTLLETHPPRALVLESTFRSVYAIAWDHYYAPRFLIADGFDTERALARYDGALLVLHGRDDQVAAPSHGRALAEATRPEGAPTATLRMLGGGHNDMERGPAYWSAIEETLRSAGVI